MRSSLVALLAVSSVLGVFEEEVAQACSPPFRTPTQIAPKDGESMPASAPGILVRGEPDLTLELLDADGGVVPGSLKPGVHRHFAPDAPLVPGAYTFRYPTWANDGGAVTVDAKITVTDEAYVPASAGWLEVAEKGFARTSVTTSSGPCTEPIDTAFVRLSLALTPDLAPYANVLAWETTVDGYAWASTEGTLTPSTAARSVLNLYTACDDAGTSGRDDGLAPGQHEVSVRPILVGSVGNSIAPATVRVWVTCGPENGSIVVVDDWSQSDGGYITDGPADDGAWRTADPAFRRPGGCTVSPWATSASLPAGLLGLAATAAWRRRRRRR